MSFRIVETYDAADSLAIAGRTYPSVCLVEDEDGLRWFVTSSFLLIHPQHWARAAAAGAVALITLTGSGYAVITAERFIDERTEAAGRYALARGWAEFPVLPSYADLFAAAPTTPRGGSRGFVHLHTHSEYSALDGRSKVAEIVDQAVADGQPATSLTDHGLNSGHPVLQKECEKAGIKPVFGIEAYFAHDRRRRPREWWAWQDSGKEVPEDLYRALDAEKRGQVEKRKDTAEVRKYYHLVLLAQTQQGLRNVWGASTEAFRDGFYYVPRMDWSTLRRFSEGVICSTGCLGGPVANPLIDGDQETARANLGRLLDIYGDRLYVELHTNPQEEQIRVNHALVALAEEYGVQCIAVVDSHYPTKDTYEEHQAWIKVQTSTDAEEDSGIFQSDLGLYMKTEAEVREALSYLDPQVVEKAVQNTVDIAASCEASIESKTVFPIFSRRQPQESEEQVRQRDIDRLIDLCLSNWSLTTGPGKPPQEEYIARFEREMALIIPKGFPGYYLQVADYVRKMKQMHVLVGPGRGSGGGSLVAYLARITGLDPVEMDLAFERFMTEGRVALPDFDVDFPATKRNVVQDYITERYGEEHVVRIGTHIRAKNRGIFKDLFRAYKSSLPEDYWRDADAISKIVEAAEASTAGLGMTWEDLWAQEGDLLAPYAVKYPQVFAMAERLVGLLKSYGKHPAGLIVADENLAQSLPLRRGEDDSEGQMISQFAMGDLEAMGLIKFDILTLRTLDTIQQCVDLIYERRGIRINPDDWKEEYLDPQVWETISEGRTLGVFQVETATGVRMCKQVQPQNIAEFADVLTLVRPGPMRSGLTDLYLERRAGRASVSVPDPRLEQVLAPTYGCILYQEQVMQTCMLLAGYDSNKADEVRKILGKKKVELVVAAGREFVEGCAAHGMDREAAERLWEQLGEFAKYSFGKAHAVGYAVLAYWTAWLKVHYPIEAFTALLSTVKQNRIPEFVTEARRFGFQIAPPDINESGRGFTPIGLGVRYGLDSLKGIGEAAVDKIIPNQPYASFEDFKERSGVDAGVTRTLARIGAFDSLGVNRRWLDMALDGQRSGLATQCVFKDTGVRDAPNGLPCTFDWASEPLPINPRTSKTLKAKPVPKRCTKACRQYQAPPPIEPHTVQPYTDEDIRNIEMDVLGIHLSSTAFDRLSEEDREVCIKQAEMIEDGPEAPYVLAVTVSKVRKHITRSGDEMAFMGAVTERNDLDVTVFPKVWEKYKAHLSVGKLLIVEVYKNDRGLNLQSLQPAL